MRPNRLHTLTIECGKGGNGVWMWLWCVPPLVVVCATTVLVCATPVLVCATPTLGCVAYLRSGNFRCHTPHTQWHTPQPPSHTPFFLVCHLFFGVPPAFWLEIINVHFKEDTSLPLRHHALRRTNAHHRTTGINQQSAVTDHGPSPSGVTR